MASTGAGVILLAPLLIAGTAALKPAWLPYAVALAAILGAVQLFMGGAVSQTQVDAAAEKAKTIAQAAKSKATSLQEQAAGAVGMNPLGGVLKPQEYQTYPLIEKHVISHNTAIYRFKLPDSNDILGLPIGQHISLAATMPGKEDPTVRAYTPITSDEDNGHFDLIIKSYPTGNISRHVGELDIGQTMMVKGPKGAMVYTPNMCRHIGMIAGGTGITPMLQVARAIQRGRKAGSVQDKTQVDLIFANVNEGDILLREDLDKLAREDPGFRVHYVLNNPPSEWEGGVGFVTGDMIKDILPAPADDIKILICGPPPMVSALKKATESLGYEKPRAVSRLPDQVFCF